MNKLFCDLKTDEEKAAFFLSGRGYETGVISQAIQNDVAMAYHRCVEYKKELEALQSQDREDAVRWRYAMDWGTKGFAVCQRVDGIGECWEPIKTNGPIDHARRIEGE